MKICFTIILLAFLSLETSAQSQPLKRESEQSQLYKTAVFYLERGDSYLTLQKKLDDVVKADATGLLAKGDNVNERMTLFTDGNPLGETILVFHLDAYLMVVAISPNFKKKLAECIILTAKIKINTDTIQPLEMYSDFLIGYVDNFNNTIFKAADGNGPEIEFFDDTVHDFKLTFDKQITFYVPHYEFRKE